MFHRYVIPVVFLMFFGVSCFSGETPKNPDIFEILKKKNGECGDHLLSAGDARRAFQALPSSLKDALKKSKDASPLGASRTRKEQDKIEEDLKFFSTYFKNANSAFQAVFPENLFPLDSVDWDVISEFIVSLVENSVSDSEILAQMDFHNGDGGYQKAIDEAKGIEANEVVIETKSVKGSDALRVVAVASTRLNAWYIQIELLSPEKKSKGPEFKLQQKEVICFGLVKRKGQLQWKGAVTHVHYREKRLERSLLSLKREALEKLPLVEAIFDPEDLQVRDGASQKFALDFLLEKTDSIESNAFHTVLLIPPLPRDEQRRELFRSFLDQYGAVSHKIRFQNQAQLKSFFKDYIKQSDAKKRSLDRDGGLLKFLMEKVQDGLPLLLFYSPFSKQRAAVNPGLISNGLPHDLEFQDLFRESTLEFVTHSRVALSLQRNAEKKPSLVSDPLDDSDDESLGEEAASSETVVADLKVLPEEVNPPSQSADTSRVDFEKLQKALATIEKQRLRIEELEAQKTDLESSRRDLAENLALDLAAEELAGRDGRIQELEDKLGQSQNLAFALNQKLLALEASGAMTEAQLKKLREVEAKGARSFEDAVEFARALHPGAFELTSQAAKQLSGLSVADKKDLALAQDVQSALLGFWHVFWAKDAPRDLEGKARRFKRLTGLVVTFDEKGATKEKLKAIEERSFEFEGASFRAWPHVKLKGNKRIYFAVDDANRRVLIHSWPEHLWTESGR